MIARSCWELRQKVDLTVADDRFGYPLCSTHPTGYLKSGLSLESAGILKDKFFYNDSLTYFKDPYNVHETSHLPSSIVIL